MHRWAAGAVLLALVPLAAWAEGGDDLKLLATVGVTHDSNLFRLPEDANTLALLGRSSAAETVTVSTLGMRYDKSYSLQRVLLDVNFNKYDYQNFNYLSFNALNYRAQWDWSYTPRLNGTISSARNQTLNSFLDFQGFNQRNERVDSTTRMDATYELDARWRLIGALGTSKRSNDLPIVQEADFSNRFADIGARYVLPSGSSVSYTLRSTDGDLLNRTFPSASFNDKAYRQTDNNLEATWVISPVTSAQFRLGHRSRTHPNYPQRDFDGLTGGANLRWTFSSKSALTAGWSRELEANEATNSNFRRIDRFNVGPVWQLSAKTALRAQIEHTIYNYEGSPSLLPASTRRDNLTNASISLDWQPYRYLSLSASLQNARRSANQPGLDFNANIVSLQAQFTY